MSSPSANSHRQRARGARACCCVLTISDTRTPATDSGGTVIVEALEAADHTLAARAIVRDQPPAIEAQLRAWIAEPGVQAILTTGGTGIARRDTTVEVVERLIDRPIPGFGELFRMLSYPQVQAAAMLSRALAGLCGDTVIFALPGSPDAVRLAMERLIIPELPHLLWERDRHPH